MLTKFIVKNFKNFPSITFDLSQTKSYEFNQQCLKDNIVSKALVYGRNAVGKSNLGYAIFDLISHATDKNASNHNYSNYIYALAEEPLAEFHYEFRFGEAVVVYRYGKTDLETLVYEDIEINGQQYASINRNRSGEAKIEVEGAEHLVRDLSRTKISLVSYIKNNAVLPPNDANEAFESFVDFVDSMLFFRSLDQNSYIGFEQGSRSIDADIIEKGNVKNFEKFLNENEVECKLDVTEMNGESTLAFVFDNKKIPFFRIASKGTQSLALFYYWYQKLKDSSKVKFLFIDEFDAYYHHALSASIIELLKDINAQTIVTTHNTSLISNELLRPDCYFLMYPERIEPLANRTPKILREAHNIEKMYRAGAFNDQ